jgi:hypothetical protein
MIAVEVLVFQGAEEPFDHAVGLRAPDSSPDVTKQRVVAGERLGEGAAAEAGAVVGDHCDGCGNLADDEVLGVDHVHPPRSARRSSRWRTRFASSTARSRQVSASAPRDAGVTVAARQ